MTKRPAPVVTDRTAAFWTGGADGELRITRCQGCGWWLHPPAPICPRCHSREIDAEAVSGHGTVWSFTVNRYPWSPSLEPPYVVAEIELDEQPGLRVMSTVIGSDDIRIGLPVHVGFEAADVDDVWIPVFTP